MTMTKKAYEKPNTELVTFDKSICDCVDEKDLLNRSGMPAGKEISFNIKLGKNTDPNWHAYYRSSALSGIKVTGYNINIPSNYSYEWTDCKTKSWEGYGACELKISATDEQCTTLMNSSTLVMYQDASGWHKWEPSNAGGWTNFAGNN